MEVQVPNAPEIRWRIIWLLLGDVHRFRYQDDSRVTMKMGGMGHLLTESKFQLERI